MSNDSPSPKKQIRNSTAEFLLFTSQAGGDSLEVRYEDETIWLTQKLLAQLFGVEVNTINYHLKEIFKSGEISEDSVIRNFRITAADGKGYPKPILRSSFGAPKFSRQTRSPKNFRSPAP